MVVAVLGVGVLSGVPIGPAVAAGTDASGAALFAWGYNDSGALGRGVGVDGGFKLSPVQVDLPVGVSATAVAAGQSFGLALADGGDVYAWGSNGTGQLGDGSVADEPWRDTPERVVLPGGVLATAISAGDAFSLALGANGAVYAWGDNEWGQIGDGDSELHRDTPVEVDLPGTVSAIAVSAGGDHSLAIGSNGAVYGWGAGASQDAAVPTPTRVDLPEGVTATAVSAGPDLSLAIGSDGAVYAWGDNGAGQLGDGSAPQSHSSPVRVDLPQGVTATAVAAGGGYGLAIGSDGAMYAWGGNSYGELGDGSTTERTTPVRVGLLPGGVAATAVSAGGAHSIALGADGNVYAWGDNYYGDLGDGGQAEQNTPEQITLPTDTPAVAVTAGSYTGLAIAGAKAPRFIAASPPETAPIGSSVSYTFVASGLPTPRYALSPGAPAWLSIDPVTGRLTGTVPPDAGSFTFSVSATNSAGSVTAGPFVVDVPFAAVPVSGAVHTQDGTALPGAVVDVCLKGGGDCESVSTDSQGAFAATAAPASTVTVTAYPPTGSGLDTGSSGPLAVPAAGLAGVTVTLSRSSPLVGLSVASGQVAGAPGEEPVFNSTVPAEIDAAGCANGIGLLTLVGQNSLTYQFEAGDYPLTESPAGSGTYAAALPPQYPIHGPVDIEDVITCPTDQGIGPDVGPTTGGQNVALSGSGFSGATAVWFGDEQATHLDVLTDGLLEVTAPAGRAGTVSVSVTDASGRAQTVGSYTYVAADDPSDPDAPDSAGATRLDSTPGHSTPGHSTRGHFSAAPDSAGATLLTGMQMDPGDSGPGGSSSSALTEVLTWVYNHFPGGAAASLRTAVATAVAAAHPSCDTDRAALEASIHLYIAAAIAAVAAAITPSLIAATEVVLSGLVDPVVAALLAPVVASLVKTAVGLILNKLADGVIDAAITAALGPCPHKTNALIDPSGTVLDTNGNPVSGATVTILRSDTQDGTFEPVDTTQPGIEPTTNPETTTGDGVFHWDVRSGYYEVSATKTNCTAADGNGDDGNGTAVIGPYPVPPPQVGLTVTMSCPGEDPAPTPVVSGLSATTGPTAGGTDVIVSGSGFTPAATVTVGDTAASTTYLGPGAIEITVPAGDPGDAHVVVHTAGGDSATSDADEFFYGDTPTVTGLDITSGPIAGGTTVTVTGTGLASASVVGFGGMPGTDLTVDSDTQLTVTSPAAATAGPVDVAVVTPAGVNAASDADQFTYTDPPNPSGPSNPGPAASQTTVAVHAHTITATVTAAPPATGTPTGQVGFFLDGQAIGAVTLGDDGTATLHYSVPAGKNHQIAAVYDGDAAFTGSSASTARHDPTITATITSRHRKSRAGWYRDPVTIRFHCTATSAPLASRCPVPLTLRHNGANQTVSRTVLAGDGGAATVTVTRINLDHTAPRLHVTGARTGHTYNRARRLACHATDPLSGVAACRITTHRHPGRTGIRVDFRATATDRAGNTTTRTGHYTIRR